MALPVLRRSGNQQATRWDPFAEFEELYDRMGWLMDAIWGGFGRPADTAAWSPLADVSETDDAYLVEVDLPGVKKDQVNVEVTGGELVITGEITQRERTGALRRATRRQGKFVYRTTLPGDVDPGKVTASLADGVLTVRVPKAETAKPRRIEITSG
jgi:HSP20 family protein